jgi:hypothetical protein
MYQLVIKPRAIEMAMEAYEWYNEQQEGLGDLFLDELESHYDRLEELPLIYGKIKRNFRQAVLHKFLM